MNIKCDFCGSMIDERSEHCPHCGAPLSGVNRTASEQPKTIEELQAWYTAHNLPPEEITRFFIGKNITEPKAFGIYKTETGDCVVYKNKSDGVRAVRYQGADEAYAVNELYQRLKAEIADQKAANSNGRPAGQNDDAKKKKKKRLGCGCLAIILFFVIGSIIAVIKSDGVPDGYYKYNNTEYYNQGDKWYKYDSEANNWLEAASLSEVITSDNASDYSFSGHEGMKFEESSWYSTSSDNDDGDWDNDSRWDDDDDWSSSSTDWDSDW
ncbi:MAG: zinc ribbon domain-containing protein [Bacteroidales bacterium]|nr:zinc ribbon domain-containing protein [Bacteroidales bacterium]